jgi:hypothetical protein
MKESDIYKLKRKITSLEAEVTRLKKALRNPRSRNKWWNDSYSTQMPKIRFTVN